MTAKRGGLGKGLDSLIKENKTAKHTAPVKKEVVNAGPIMMKINDVEPNRDQPRKHFEEDALLELADSIKQFGILQPLIVQKRNDYYEIIAGERRWRAAKQASYREGIDTLEEYKENKALIAKERDSLEQQLAELEENTPDKIPDDPTPKMLDRVSSVHDILVSDSYSLVQKNEALKQIIDKIVYDRESDTLKIHFFLYHS